MQKILIKQKAGFQQAKQAGIYFFFIVFEESIDATPTHIILTGYGFTSKLNIIHDSKNLQEQSTVCNVCDNSDYI